MIDVFADTSYSVALIDPRDQWNSSAVAAAKRLGSRRIVTTEDVLTEFLAFFAGRGSRFREAAALTVRSILQDSSSEVVAQGHELFISGLVLYEGRLDKGYSLTDCVSMTLMRERGMTEVLTNDAHFTQEGFIILLPTA